ncbi:MAG: hypothetical protein GX369_00305 [Euryarchaeota archaeon]|nr:hypothetical protein [Euryarchaeota archaeon]
MKRIGWFTTARGPGSFGLFATMIQHLDSGSIEANLSFVFINRDIRNNEYRKKIIEMAKERDIPVIILPSDTFRQDLKSNDISAWRNAYGEELRRRIAPYNIDLGVLAGYMLIVDPETCRQYLLINLHPALPDTYKGTWNDIIIEVAKSNDSTYGSTVHLCSPVLDCGAPIAFDSFPIDDLRSNISHEELSKAIRQREVEREIPLLMQALKLIVSDSVVIREGKLFDSQGCKLKGPVDLSEQISAAVERRD